jgi:nicotinamide-nucleotide amidase
MGVVDGRVSTDTEAFLRTRGLERLDDDPAELSWRSGLKHDCAAVMELAVHPEGYRNGLGHPVDLEPDRVYPLLKGSDVANGRSPGLRAVVVPQRSLQEDTLELAQSAPRTFAYLRANERALAARKSRVYEGRPPFAIFGIGPYTFSSYKVAVCGLYKRLAFRLITPFEGMPVLVDDTVTFLPFDDEATASRVVGALNGPMATAFFEARVFWDEKRPIGKALLSALSIRKLLEASERTSKPNLSIEHPRSPPMQSAILTIGTELTRGELVNTNATWLSARLTGLGFDVVEQSVIADDRATIVATFERLSNAVGLVLVTGGLGPTTDDLTTACAAEAMGVPLLRDPASLEHIRARFERLKRTMTPSNEKQADFPEGAEVLPNPIGSAPGFAIVLGKARVFFMPGVPREMKTMFDDQIAPRIEKHAKKDTFQVRLRTFGLPESHVGDRLAGLEEANPGLTIGYRANFPEVEVKVHVRAEDFESAKARSEALAAVVRERLGDFVFGEGEETFASVLAKALVEKKLTLAVAESCTGGLVGHLLTREAGASAYLLVDAVTYANEAKTRFADVSEDLLRAHGAVSPEVARAMAEGIRSRSGADVGLSLTGVAGPLGGSPEKPVGTVFLAVATREGTTVKHVLFVQERTMVQAYAAHAGLDLVRQVVATLA